jgi:hypothetical protein
MQLELQQASRVPLLRTPPEGFCSSSYKHATPNGVKTVNAFFHGFGKWVDDSSPVYKLTHSIVKLIC